MQNNTFVVNHVDKEVLEKLQAMRISAYRRSRTVYSIPKRLFIDGEFNTNNWNGGDAALIRRICNLVIDEEEIFSSNKFAKDGTSLHIEVEFDDDDWRVNFKFGIKGVEESYTIGWYKSRGQTEIAEHNGETMTENEYIEFINMLLDVTGYEFTYQINTPIASIS